MKMLKKQGVEGQDSSGQSSGVRFRIHENRLASMGQAAAILKTARSIFPLVLSARRR